MTINSFFRKVVDAATDITGIGLASLIFLLIAGRAANSATAARLDALPFVGFFTKPIRGALNQGYDPAGQE